jgi:hypothetical protein
MSKKWLSDKDFASGDAFFRGMFGKNAKTKLLEDQRELVAYEVSETELPTPMTVKIGSAVIKDFEGDKVALVQNRMPFATVLRFEDAGYVGPDIDFRKEAMFVKAMLQAHLPRPYTGRYAKDFRYVIGGVATIAVPTADFTIIGVTNIATYASTLENNPDWPRTFHKAWPKVRSRARTLGYDARLRYLQGSSRIYNRKGMRVDPHDGSNRRGPMQYAVPIIEIGPLNSMDNKTGLRPSRHRKPSVRRKRGRS